METITEQPSAVQNIEANETTLNVAQNIDPSPHSVAEQVEDSCDKEIKSCDSQMSSAATEEIRAQYAREEGYEYLQRGHSTEIFKIVISNVHPKMGYSVS